MRVEMNDNPIALLETDYMTSLVEGDSCHEPTKEEDEITFMNWFSL